MYRNKKGQAAPKAAQQSKIGPKMQPKVAKSQVGSSRALPQRSVAAAYSSGQSSGEAQVFRNSVNSCRIRHRELVTSLTGSVAFTVANNLSVNPGLPTTFPWLSVEAQGWEKYHFNMLKLCYYTRTGSNVPGSVILAADYDAADAAPASEQIVSAYQGTQEDAPWKDLCFTFDQQRLAGERFIRTGGLSANLDVKTYDVANAFVCTTDGTAVNWGKVWIEYDITLYNPQLPASGPLGSNVIVGGGGSLAAATPFGATPVSTGSYSGSAAGLVLSYSGLSIGTEYILTVGIEGTAISALTIASETGMTAKSADFSGSQINAASTAAMTSSTFTATAVSGTVTITCTATTVTKSQAVFSALSPAPSI